MQCYPISKLGSVPARRIYYLDLYWKLSAGKLIASLQPLAIKVAQRQLVRFVRSATHLYFQVRIQVFSRLLFSFLMASI